MPTLLFTLSPAAVGQLHDLLSCLAKFDEAVSWEATADNFRMSSLNLTKTAHASFDLTNTFFTKYHFSNEGRGPIGQPRPWTCRIQNRALLAIFRRRLADPREKDVALERLDFELQARPDQTECRLVFKLICRQGVEKKYRLYYETGEILHASFDQEASTNAWTVASRTLRDVVEYFGPKTEHLDWCYKDAKVTFTSYTEKIQNGKEILKQPMHTSVAVERKDFNAFNVQEGLHIGIIVKDFRSIVAHAETMKVDVTARYSRGNRPMQIAYSQGGVAAHFTLMTRATSSHVPDASRNSTPARDLSMRGRSQTPSMTRDPSVPATTQTAPTDMPPPSTRPSARPPATRPALLKGSGTADTPAPSASLNPDSLFIPADDEDQKWDEPNYEEDRDIVTWDNASDSASLRRIRNSESDSFVSVPDGRKRTFDEIAPTQRLSQVKGLFD
jgi:cell cycle checkpoint control protein RAD9A